MLKSSKYFIFANILCLALLSCNQSNNKNTYSNDSKGSLNIQTSTGQTSEPAANTISFPQSNSPIKTEILVKYLPKEIKGTTKAPSNQGMQTWKGKQVATVSSEYTYDGGGIIFNIVDYGNIGNIPREELDAFNSGGKGLPGVYRISFGYGKGYVTWNDNEKSGNLCALCGNRLVVKIDVFNIPNTTPKIEDLLNSINFDNLLKETQKQKN